jgi:hypothetical protein
MVFIKLFCNKDFRRLVNVKNLLREISLHRWLVSRYISCSPSFANFTVCMYLQPTCIGSSKLQPIKVLCFWRMLSQMMRRAVFLTVFKRSDNMEIFNISIIKVKWENTRQEFLTSVIFMSTSLRCFNNTF